MLERPQFALNIFEDLDSFSFNLENKERYRYINRSIIIGRGQGQFMLGLGFFFLNGGWLRIKRNRRLMLLRSFHGKVHNI